MNPNELLNADHRVLSGLIGRVWSTETSGADTNIAKENAELFIRMYLKEKFDDHHLRGAAVIDSVDPTD